jgi:predicted DNA-binding transcriptional regulator AlpA
MPEELTKNGLVLVDPNCLKQLLADVVNEAIERHFDKPKEDKMLKIKEVAALLETDPSTLWHWDKEGYLKKIYIGGKPRYKESEVMAILEGRQRTKKTNTQ